MFIVYRVCGVSGLCWFLLGFESLQGLGFRALSLGSWCLGSKYPADYS